VGKTSEREEVLLISSNLKITSAKINQQQLLISSLRFPCLKCTGRKPTTATSKNVHTQPYRTDCTDFWKFMPRICCSCTAAVRTVKNIFFSRFACCGVCNRYRNLCCIKSVPYGLINAAGCLDLRAQLCLENCASSSAALSSSENRNPSPVLALSQSLKSLMERMNSFLVFFLL
jgi:hypothetical protein